MVDKEPRVRTTPAASMRIVPELRAAHIERHRLGTPAELLYLDTNYDLAGTPLVAGIRRVTMPGALRRFLRTGATTLEVPEPYWMRFWPKHLGLVLGFKAAGVLRHRRHRVVTYAMENNALATLVGGRRRVPGWAVRAVALLIGGVARLTLDRICFASDAARVAYARLPFLSGVDQRTTLELPRANDTSVSAEPLSCVFLGVLEERKGLRGLTVAWSAVEEALPDARLSIVGPGPLQAELEAWAARRPDSRTVLGRLPHGEAGALLASSSVLVAPSVPDGRWIEQIGLPIKEALAAGLTVVTTDQTGLAPWLVAHGHEVVDVDPSGLPERLATALVRALRNPLDRDEVRAALPDRDGRLVADAWLHELVGGTSSATGAPEADG